MFNASSHFLSLSLYFLYEKCDMSNLIAYCLLSIPQTFLCAFVDFFSPFKIPEGQVFTMCFIVCEK